MKDFEKMSTKELATCIDYLVDRVNAVLDIYSDCDNLCLDLNPLLKLYIDKLRMAQNEFVNRFSKKEDM